MESKNYTSYEPLTFTVTLDNLEELENSSPLGKRWSEEACL